MPLIQEYISLNTLETDFGICFVEHLSDAVMKRGPFGFFTHFRNPVHDRQRFFFFGDFKTQMFSIFCVFIHYLITTFISFAVSVISMSNSDYFIQYYFNIILFTYNSNIAGYCVSRCSRDSSDIFFSDTNLPLSDCLSLPRCFLHFFF